MFSVVFLRLAGAKIDTLPVSCLPSLWPQWSPLPHGHAGAQLWFPLAPGTRHSGCTVVSLSPLNECCQLAWLGCPHVLDPGDLGQTSAPRRTKGIPRLAACIPAVSLLHPAADARPRPPEQQHVTGRQEGKPHGKNLSTACLSSQPHPRPTAPFPTLTPQRFK